MATCYCCNSTNNEIYVRDGIPVVRSSNQPGIRNPSNGVSLAANLGRPVVLIPYVHTTLTPSQIQVWVPGST